VIDLRRRFYPDRDGVTTIAASVTDSAWWSGVPVGRPLIVVGEGLLMYLAGEGVRTVIDTIMRQPAPERTLIFDTVRPWVCRVAGWQPNMRRASTGFRSSTRDLDTAVHRHPDLTLDDDTLSSTQPVTPLPARSLHSSHLWMSLRLGTER